MTELMRRRRNLMSAKSAHPVLPDEFQQVEWIQANADCGIITNIEVETDTPVLKLRYYKQTQATHEQSLIMTTGSLGETGLEIGFTDVTNRIFAFSRSSAQIIDPMIYGNVVDVTVTVSDQSPYIEMLAKSGDLTAYGSKTGQNAKSIGGSRIYLFANQIGQLNAAGTRLYNFSVENNGLETINLVPCYRKVDGVIGLYDLVSETFMSNAFSGTFTKGADV